MLKIPIATWIANAAACLNGTYGHVTHQADRVDCSRQTVSDHASKVQAAVVAEHQGGPTRAELVEQNQHLRQENAQLWDWLAQTIEFPTVQQREFAITAAAMGLSLNQVLVLLTLILGKPAGSGRSTVHRWIKAAGLAAGRVLKSLDARCRALVLVGCLDEIFFHGRPVLVGIEPASMTWFLGQKANDRSGATWAKALRDWTALEFVTADAGTGLQAGIAGVQQGRREQGQTPLENSLDVFHVRVHGLNDSCKTAWISLVCASATTCKISLYRILCRFVRLSRVEHLRSESLKPYDFRGPCSFGDADGRTRAPSIAVWTVNAYCSTRPRRRVGCDA